MAWIEEDLNLRQCQFRVQTERCGWRCGDAFVDSVGAYDRISSKGSDRNLRWAIGLPLYPAIVMGKTNLG
jgi:hypothetical protein